MGYTVGMSEQSSTPDSNNRSEWLKLKFWVEKFRGNTGARGTDGSTLSGSSQLDSKPGLNEKPSLTQGQSGGGTTPPGQSVPKK